MSGRGDPFQILFSNSAVPPCPTRKQCRKFKLVYTSWIEPFPQELMSAKRSL